MPLAAETGCNEPGNIGNRAGIPDAYSSV